MDTATTVNTEAVIAKKELCSAKNGTQFFKLRFKESNDEYYCYALPLLEDVNIGDTISATIDASTKWKRITGASLVCRAPETPAPAPTEDPVKESAKAQVKAPTSAPTKEKDAEVPTPRPVVKRNGKVFTISDEDKAKILFPLIPAEYIDVRVQECKEGYVSLLLYRDARYDAAMLDAMFGVLGWKKSFRTVEGRLYCCIEVYNKEIGQWIGKEDVGTESNNEPEKGLASDAFKRAAVAFGIGRELYTSPFIIVSAKDTVIVPNGNGFTCKDSFYVYSVEYENREIVGLEIRSVKKNKVVFKLQP